MVNNTLQSQEEVDKVKDVMSQIESYSAVASTGDMERVSARIAPCGGHQPHPLVANELI